MIFFAAAAINADDAIVGVALSQMPPEDSIVQDGSRLVGIGAMVCRPLPDQRAHGRMVMDIMAHVEMVNGVPRFKESIRQYASQVIYHDAITESEIRAAVEVSGAAAVHSLLGAWIAQRLSPNQKDCYGAEFTPSERHKEMAKRQLMKWTLPDELPTGFKAFEATKVAEVHQRIAADSAFAEMAHAINNTENP